MPQVTFKLRDLMMSDDPTRLIVDRLIAESCPIFWKGGTPPFIRKAEPEDVELPIEVRCEDSFPDFESVTYSWK